MNTRDKYHIFLKSSWWKSLRKKKLSKFKECYICSSKDHLHIHHAGYENLYKGKSNKALRDTYVLCAKCHKSVHDYQRANGYSYERTKVVVEGWRMNKHATNTSTE